MTMRANVPIGVTRAVIQFCKLHDYPTFVDALETLISAIEHRNLREIHDIHKNLTKIRMGSFLEEYPGPIPGAETREYVYEVYDALKGRWCSVMDRYLEQNPLPMTYPSETDKTEKARYRMTGQTYLTAKLLRSNITGSTAVLESLHDLAQPLEKAAQLVADCLLGGHTLLTCGNGGSAADGGHIATEFVARFDSGRDRRPYAAICLSDSASAITAISNDYGFEHTFSRQVEAFARPGDVLIAISTSGNSPNIRLALEAAKKMKIASISLLGKGGGKAKGLADVELLVPSPITARVQEAHLLLYHTLCQAVDDQLLKRENPA